MRTKTVVAFILFASLVGIGCQQQGKPRHAESVKGLNKIYFDFDSSDIKSEAKKTLEDNAGWLKKNGNAHVTVEGHCDERGSIEYNLSLGERRAQAVKSYMTSLGIPASRISIISYGKEKPLTNGDSESDYAKNRRANFVPLGN